MPGRIWLIGGTQESGQIAQAFAYSKLPCTVTVTTSNALTLYPQITTINVRVGQLTEEGLSNFLQQEKIVAIVDASHPYAVQISQMAIAAATHNKIPYLRYERPTVISDSSREKVIELDSFATLLTQEYLLKQRVLLTVGCKALSLFRPWQTRSTLFARVLPVVHSIEVAIAAGFTPERLIALRPPITAELELALWQQWGITLVVTKASGKAGGEEIKRLVAAQLKIPLIVIARPEVMYPQQTDNLADVINFCTKVLEEN